MPFRRKLGTSPALTALRLGPYAHIHGPTTSSEVLDGGSLDRKLATDSFGPRVSLGSSPGTVTASSGCDKGSVFIGFGGVWSSYCLVDSSVEWYSDQYGSGSKEATSSSRRAFSSSSPGRGLVSGVGDDEACTDHRSWTRQKRARWGLVEKTLCVL